MTEKKHLVPKKRCQNCRWYTPAGALADNEKPWGRCFVDPPEPVKSWRPRVEWDDRCARWKRFSVEAREFSGTPKGVRA